MAKMEELRKMATELRNAYNAQTAAEKVLSEARNRQSYWRSEIVKLLGHDEAGEFLDMLREQTGLLTTDDLFDNYRGNVMEFGR